MQTIKKIILFAFLLLAGTAAWAQRDYRKGYIINNRQDTVYGWIDYRGDIRNSKTCAFKVSENDAFVEYAPSDIIAYRYIDSKFYISKNIGSTDAPKQVFLECLINGLATIYYYRDDGSNEHFYIEKDGKLHELKTDRKEVEVDGRTQISTVKSYVGTLKAALNVWEMSGEIDNAKLEHSSLINIAKNYHQYACTDGSECIIYEKKKPSLAMRIGPVVGVDISMLKLIVEGVDKNKFDHPTNLTAGVNLNLWAPRVNEKIFLQIRAMYAKNHFFDAYESPQRSIFTHVRSNVLKMGFALKYEYPKGKLRPTLAAGFAAIWMPDGSIEEITNTHYISGDVISTDTKDFPTKLLRGIEISPGLQYHLPKSQIIFLQMQYIHCTRREAVSYPVNVLRSLGLSMGFYF